MPEAAWEACGKCSVSRLGVLSLWHFIKLTCAFLWRMLSILQRSLWLLAREQIGRSGRSGLQERIDTPELQWPGGPASLWMEGGCGGGDTA